MNIIQMLCPASKYYLKCPNSMTPSYITVHNTASDAGAKAEISYMLSNNKSTSYHFAVDEDEAIQGLPLDRNGWHAGDGNGKGNRASIGIEICRSLSGGSRFTQAEKNGAYLVAYLLKKYGWGIDRVRKHQDWSGKYCPHRTLDMGWQRFLNMVKSYMDGTIKYQAHCQTYGWLPEVWDTDNDYAGTVGQAKRMEAVKITAPSINIRYRVHCQTYGWMDWVNSGEVAGTTGQGKRMEAIIVEANIPIKYRVHMQGIGWGAWVTNGQVAGTTGEARRLEAIEIKKE